MTDVRRLNPGQFFEKKSAGRWSVRRRGPVGRVLGPCILLSVAFALNACGGKAALPYPGTGLSLRDGNLTWELTVGVLNSRDFPRINRKQARLFLDRAAADLGRKLPGLKVRFILDQPLDAPFMMERLIRKKQRLEARYRADAPVLLLDDSSSSRELNRKKTALPALDRARIDKARIASTLRNLEFLRGRTLPGSGKPLLNDRMESSDLVWREFLRQQVRYDVVLTNALVFGDDLRVPARFQTESGGVRMRISRAEGRTGMEGLAAFISLYGYQSGSDQAGTYERDLKAVLLALLLRVPAASFLPREKKGRASPATRFPDCPGCSAFWKRRLGYLRGIAHIHRANFAEGCPLLKANRPGPEPTPAFLRMGVSGRKLAEGNHGLLVRKCPSP